MNREIKISDKGQINPKSIYLNLPIDLQQDNQNPVDSDEKAPRTLSYLQFTRDSLNIHATSFYAADRDVPLYVVTEKSYGVTDELSQLKIGDNELLFCSSHRLVITTKLDFAIFLCLWLQTDRFFNYGLLKNDIFQLGEEVFYYDTKKETIYSDAEVIGLPDDENASFVTIKFGDEHYKKKKKVRISTVLKKDFRLPIHVTEQIFKDMSLKEFSRSYNHESKLRTYKAFKPTHNLYSE